MALSFGFCLSGSYSAHQFSRAWDALFGSGVSGLADRLRLTLGSGWCVYLAPGFAFRSGRWLLSDETLRLDLPPAYNNADRWDAVALDVNSSDRTVTLEIRSDVDPETTSPAYLYLLRIRRGASTLYESDVTDLRVHILSLAALSAQCLPVYEFLNSGIDRRTARVTEQAAQCCQSAQSALTVLDAAVRARRGHVLGDLFTAAAAPAPEMHWLLCRGGPVPEEYADLSELLGGVLPDAAPEDARLHTWIYAAVD